MIIFETIPQLVAASLQVGKVVNILGETTEGDKAVINGRVRASNYTPLNPNQLITIANGNKVELFPGPGVFVTTGEMRTDSASQLGGVYKKDYETGDTIPVDAMTNKLMYWHNGQFYSIGTDTGFKSNDFDADLAAGRFVSAELATVIDINIINSSIDIENIGLVAGLVVNQSTASKNRELINEHIKNGGVFHFNGNPYLIALDDNNKGVKCTSGTVINGNGTAFHLFDSNQSSYEIVHIDADVNGLVINDLDVYGDVDNHIGSGGEWGFGFLIRSSKNVTLNRCNGYKCWGDGIYIGVDMLALDIARNITLNHCNARDNRRNDLTIVAGEVTINGGNIDLCGKTLMTLPGAGIDIEPNPNEYADLIVEMNNVSFSRNYNAGLLLALDKCCLAPRLPDKDYVTCIIKVNNPIFREDGGTYTNSYSPALRIVGGLKSSTAVNKVVGLIEINHPSIIQPRHIPIQLSNIGFLPPIKINKTYITDLNSAFPAGSASPSNTCLVDLKFSNDAVFDTAYEYSELSINGLEYFDSRGVNYSSTISDTNHSVLRPILFTDGNATTMRTPLPENFWSLSDFKTNINLHQECIGQSTEMRIFKYSGEEHMTNVGQSKTSWAGNINGLEILLDNNAGAADLTLPNATQQRYINKTVTVVVPRQNAITIRVESDNELIDRDGNAISVKAITRSRGAGKYKFYCPQNGTWCIA